LKISINNRYDLICIEDNSCIPVLRVQELP
jgi:hypothetical protein